MSFFLSCAVHVHEVFEFPISDFASCFSLYTSVHLLFVCAYCMSNLMFICVWVAEALTASSNLLTGCRPSGSFWPQCKPCSVHLSPYCPMLLFNQHGLAWISAHSACCPDVDRLLLFLIEFAHIKLWINLPWYCSMAWYMCTPESCCCCWCCCSSQCQRVICHVSYGSLLSSWCFYPSSFLQFSD